MPQPNDFLVKRNEQTVATGKAAEGAPLAWFGPVDAGDQRHRFLVVREAGDDLSVVPGGEARFKTGLKAWRWPGPVQEGVKDEPTTYLVVKTTARRVDLKKVTK
jgi:hypothetical protein